MIIYWSQFSLLLQSTETKILDFKLTKIKFINLGPQSDLKLASLPCRRKFFSFQIKLVKVSHQMKLIILHTELYIRLNERFTFPLDLKFLFFLQYACLYHCFYHCGGFAVPVMLRSWRVPFRIFENFYETWEIWTVERRNECWKLSAIPNNYSDIVLERFNLFLFFDLQIV